MKNIKTLLSVLNFSLVHSVRRFHFKHFKINKPCHLYIVFFVWSFYRCLEIIIFQVVKMLGISQSYQENLSYANGDNVLQESINVPYCICATKDSIWGQALQIFSGFWK